jgi:serine/threonine protein kinase
VSKNGDAVPFGRYLLLERLGEGGMAVVHRARASDAGEDAPTLVVKRIRPELSKDVKFIDMLVAEARLSGMLRHPGIVQVYELGDVDGEFYLAMEDVDGWDLTHIFNRCDQLERRVPVELACLIVHRVALALGYAHALTDPDGKPLNIVHRDISPSNIMISRQGQVKLLDFGIAKATTQVQEERTRTGMLKGKLTYMSPEQAEGEATDRRADIFALGVVFWEGLTAQRLFRGDSDLQTLKLVRRADVAPPSRLNPAVTPAIDAIVMKMLARPVAERAASCEEVAAALQPRLDRARVDEASLRRLLEELQPIAPYPPAAAVTRTVSKEPTVPPPMRRRRHGVNLPALFAGLALAGAIVFAVVRARDRNPVQSPPPAAAPVTSVGADTSPPAATPTSAPTVAAPTIPPASAPTSPPIPAAASTGRVRLRVNGTRGAQVWVDGLVVGEIPVAAQLHPLNGRRVISVRKAGYRTRELVVAGDQDMRLTVQLERKAAPATHDRSPDLFDPFHR